MNSQVVLISGCSSGMGLVTAVVLAKDPEKRFKVYATMRNLARKGQLEEEGKEHLGDTLIIKQMDVCSDESVNKTVEEVLEKEGRIDVLFNNAGTGAISPVECCSIKMAQELFDTNFFGPLRLIKAVVPSMKARQSGHIITTTGLISLVAVPFAAINAASKFAVEGLTESISPTLRQFNIRCTLFEPGFVLTAAYQRKDVVQAFTPDYTTADPKTKQLMERVLGELQKEAAKTTVTAEMVAESIKEIILDKESNFRCQTKSDFLAEEIASKIADPTGNKVLEAITKRFFGSENRDEQ